MSWELLQGLCRTPELGYSIISAGKRARELKFTIAAELLARCGWTAETRVRLMNGTGKDAGCCRLDAVPHEGRKLAVIGVSGRAHLKFTWDEEVAAIFDEREGLYGLDVFSADKVDGIIFTKPGCEPDGEEGEA